MCFSLGIQTLALRCTMSMSLQSNLRLVLYQRDVVDGKESETDCAVLHFARTSVEDQGVRQECAHWISSALNHFQFPSTMVTLCLRLSSVLDLAGLDHAVYLVKTFAGRGYSPTPQKRRLTATPKRNFALRRMCHWPRHRTWHGPLTADTGDWTEHCHPDTEGPHFLNVPRQPAC